MNQTRQFVSFQVLAVLMLISVFWVVTPYELVYSYQRFGETYYLHLQGRETECFSKTSVSTYKSIRRYNPEDQHRQTLCSRTDSNLLSNVYPGFFLRVGGGEQSVPLQESPTVVVEWLKLCFVFGRCWVQISALETGYAD
jgi:hypothetical protein